MKFIIAKKDGIECRGCQGFIQRGDEMVQNFIPTSNHSIVLSYHVGCYIPWYTDMFNRKWRAWKAGIGSNPLPPKRGRPIIHLRASKKIKINRLRALRTYHRKLGHRIKVKMIQNELGKLCIT